MPRDTWDTSRVPRVFVYRTFTFCGVLSQTLLLTFDNPTLRSHNPFNLTVEGLDCFLFARRYWGNPIRFLFQELLRCFNSLRVALNTYVFSIQYPDMTRDGFSHWEIFGSMPVCDSPKHIAAYHVLHRLSLPSYPS